MRRENTNCSIHDSCERIVPSRLVLLDNIHTAILFLLGSALVRTIWRPFAIFMMLYNLSSIVMFWGLSILIWGPKKHASKGE